MFASTTDEMIECPYNPSHRMLRKRLQSHLIKCRVQYPNAELRKCVFNTTHLIPEPEFTYHLANCSDRKLITQYKYDAPEPKEEDKPKHAPIECEENWDDTDVIDYDPSKYIEKAKVLRRVDGNTPRERKLFIKKERKRLGDPGSDDDDDVAAYDKQSSSGFNPYQNIEPYNGRRSTSPLNVYPSSSRPAYINPSPPKVYYSEQHPYYRSKSPLYRERSPLHHAYYRSKSPLQRERSPLHYPYYRSRSPVPRERSPLPHPYYRSKSPVLRDRSPLRPSPPVHRDRSPLRRSPPGKNSPTQMYDCDLDPYYASNSITNGSAGSSSPTRRKTSHTSDRQRLSPLSERSYTSGGARLPSPNRNGSHYTSSSARYEYPSYREHLPHTSSRYYYS